MFKTSKVVFSPRVRKTPYFDSTIKYGAQVHHSPPIFALFSNHPNDIPVQYKRYLENSLRDNFGFNGVPIKISFRENK